MAKSVALPSNLEAEKSVLGSALLDEGAAASVLSSLTEDSFSGIDVRNVYVFRAMKELANRKENIDAVTLSSTLENMHLLEAAGGIEYISELVDSVVDPSFFDNYVKIVNDTAILRDYLKQMQQSINTYQKEGAADIGDFLQNSLGKLSTIAEGRSVGDFKSAAVVSKLVEQRIDELSNRKNDKRLTGVDTGYSRLNAITHGWQKGNLIIIAARPGMGKTAMAANLAINATKNEKKTVGFFSIEMSSEEIFTRLLSAESGVVSDKLATGNLNATDKLKVSTALGSLSKTKLYLDDTQGIKLGDLMAKARKLKKAHPDLCLIVIDYLAKITTEDSFQSETERLGVITGSLKQLARNLKIPVICLAQLNREVEENKDSKPKLSNLRGSGNIEQDADIVILLYRADYYEELGAKAASTKGVSKEDLARREQEEAETLKKKNSPISIVELLIAKNRSGQNGSVTLMFNKALSKFENAPDEFEEKVALVKQGRKPDAIDVSD